MSRPFILIGLLATLGCGSESTPGASPSIPGDTRTTSADTQHTVDSQNGGDTESGDDTQTQQDTALANDTQPPPPCAEGVSCDDLDPCTLNDMCTNGVCAGTLSPCDDGLECTQDICDGKGGCSVKLIPGDWCFIDGACHPDGSLNPGNPCEACVTPVIATSWTASDGAVCDDGLECTGEDRCSNGFCYGSSDPCEDGNPCTTDSCKEGEGCIHAAQNGPCEDGDFCTVGDTCTNQICYPGPKELDCSDGDPCTMDSCQAGGGCAHEPHSGPCSDGDPCTTGDVCVQGACSPGTSTLLCDDGNACTNDVCITGTGCAYIPNLEPCEDGDVCTEGDTCSNGVCTTGFFSKECDDENGCTKDICEAFKGCKYLPQVGTCDDGNPCTENDTCQNNYCQGGAFATCNDDDICTDDTCDAKVVGGCVYTNNQAPCDDGELCTENDACQDGACTAVFADCDDQNACTVDICDEVEGCSHVVDGSVDSCLLRIDITTPARAVTLTGNSTVLVTGKVTSPAAPLASFQLNGLPLDLGPNGVFSIPMAAQHGINLIHAEAVDELGNTDKAARSFQFSTSYQPMSASNPAASAMARALYLYLGPAVLDDGNHAPNDVDDFATIFEFVMASFNLNDLLPNPLLNNGDYKVTVENISFQPAQVQLIPITGGMQMHISIDNFHADIDADGKCFFCPSADGTIDIDRMIIIAPVKIKTVNGAIDVQLQDPDVTLVNPDVDINGILGSILDFIVDLVIDGLAPSLEEKFEEELGTLVPGILEEALDSLAFNTSFDMPAIFPGGGAVTINLQTGLEHTFWTTEGGILRMWGAATTSKAIPYSVLGTIRRDGCSTGISESLQLSKAGDLQFGLSNDLLNQILFSVWWGGGLSFPIPPEDLVTQDLSGFGVSDLTLEIDFLLPPMITNCNSNQDLVLQLGDVRVHATAILFGKPIELDIFITAEAYVELGASAAGVSLAVSDIKEVASEVVVLTSGYATAESLVDTLVSEEVTPLLFEQLGSEALAGFPLPAIDLSGLADGVPSGTAIAIDPNNAEQVLGWTVVSGSIQ